MKNILIIFLLILLIVFGCTNDSQPAAESAEVDSISTMSMSVMALAEPGQTTTITKVIKLPAWQVEVKNADGTIASSDIVYTDPATPPPPPPTNNKPPLIKTGPDQTTANNSVTLNGSGSSDPDGQIVSYKWTQDNGNLVTMTGVGAVSTVTGLVKGDYRFRLVITDDDGASTADTIHIKCTASGTNPPPTNAPPVVNAGSNQTITLPVSSVTLNGSATDQDGTIASYTWSKTSGTGGTIVTPNGNSTQVTGLTQGTYVFSLRAMDNGGASTSKSVTITVNPAGGTTPPPTGNYGTVIYSTGYDQLSDILNGNGQEGNGGLSTTIKKSGAGSFRSAPANVSSGIRSEVQYSDNQTPTEGAIEYDVYYEVIIPNNGHSLQFHPHTSGGSASPGLWHTGGKFVLNNWKGGSNTSHTTGVTIQTNKWYHMVLEYKFGSSGYLKLTIDGVVVLNKTGIQVGDGSGQYLKVGYNGWDGNSTSSRIYYDNLKIWKK